MFSWIVFKKKKKLNERKGWEYKVIIPGQGKYFMMQSLRDKKEELCCRNCKMLNSTAQSTEASGTCQR